MLSPIQPRVVPEVSVVAAACSGSTSLVPAAASSVASALAAPWESVPSDAVVMKDGAGFSGSSSPSMAGSSQTRTVP